MDTNNLLGLFSAILSGDDAHALNVLKDVYIENDLPFPEPVKFCYFLDNNDEIWENDGWEQITLEDIPTREVQTPLEAYSVMSIIKSFGAMVDFDRDKIVYELYDMFIGDLRLLYDVMSGRDQPPEDDLEEYFEKVESCNNWFNRMISKMGDYECIDSIYYPIRV